MVPLLLDGDQFGLFRCRRHVPGEAREVIVRKHRTGREKHFYLRAALA